MADLPNKIETIVITNFGGRLTRLLNGELNSGFAKYSTSFGYDPFTKPMNLTWFEQPVDITGPTGTGLVVAAKPRPKSAMTVFAVNHIGSLLTIQSASVFAGSPNVDSVVGIASVIAGNPTYLYGASMDFYGASEKIYISNDNSINSINFDGTAETTLGTSNMAANAFHPLKQFAGKLLFGNGNTIAAIAANTGTITSSAIGTGQGNYYSELNPALGVESYVHDLDVSTDGNQALITASGVPTEQILTPGSDGYGASANDGYVYRWNGSDQTTTSLDQIPSYAVTALQTYLQNNTFFSNDSLGASINDGTNKIMSLPGNKSPLPNATAVNGNFLTWVCPEISPDGTTLNASMYYLGQLDQENPPGLFRMFRMTSPLSNGFVYQNPLNILVSNKNSTLNSAKTAVSTQSYGKHYFSTMSVLGGSTQYNLHRFLITSSGTGTPQLGVYETQTQLFSKRMTVKQIRVYTEPTAANNGFQIDLIGSDGTVITNGTFNYTFAAGTDITKLQGALERIDFNPAMKDTYALGLRITNTGTSNMTIKKFEIDWTVSGK